MIQKGEFDASQRTQFVEQSVSYDSGFENYQKFLGFELEDLKGNNVLDIGGQPNGFFAAEAESIGAKVVTFNPKTSGESRKHNDIVAGLAQQMPFKNESFDIVLAYASVPAYLPQFEPEYRETFSEMLRVLKPGGKIYIFPIMEEMAQDPVFGKIMRDIAKGNQIKTEAFGTGTASGQVGFRLIITKSKNL